MSTIKLSRPVMDADGKLTNTITLREPNGRDIRTCGYPLRFAPNDTDLPEFIPAAMSAMIAATGNLFPPTVDDLPLGDWTKLAFGIAGFLGVTEPTLSTDTTTAPGSGAATSPT